MRIFKFAIAILVATVPSIGLAQSGEGAASAGAGNLGDARGGGYGSGNQGRAEARDGGGSRGDHNSNGRGAGRAPAVEPPDAYPVGSFIPMPANPGYSVRVTNPDSDGFVAVIQVNLPQDHIRIEWRNGAGEVRQGYSGSFSGYRASGGRPHTSDYRTDAPLWNYRIVVGYHCSTAVGVSPPGHPSPLGSFCTFLTPNGEFPGVVVI